MSTEFCDLIKRSRDDKASLFAFYIHTLRPCTVLAMALRPVKTKQRELLLAQARLPELVKLPPLKLVKMK